MSAHGGSLAPSVPAAADWGTQPLYEKLRPAPHARPAEQVAQIQRARLCGAIVQAVAEHGYAKVTVSRLHRLAGVSKHTLYDRFGRSDAKRACLLAAIDAMLEIMLEHVQAQQRQGRDWRERLSLTLDALARQAARHPAGARVLLVEAYEPDAGALEILMGAYERLEELLADCFVDLPCGQDPQPLIVKGILAAAAQIARLCLLNGREQQLPRLAKELAAWACACCEGTALPARSVTEHVSGPSTLASAFSAIRDVDICEERLWMLEACARLAGEYGYGWLTISRIEKEARVPRGALRRHFTGVRECFTSAYEMACAQALSGALAHPSAPYSPAGPRTLLERLAGQLADQPTLVRVAFCELLAAGPAGVRAQTRLIEGFAHTLADQSPRGRRPSPVALTASVAAVWGVAGHLAACGRAQRLPANRQILARLVPPTAARGTHPAEGVPGRLPAGSRASDGASMASGATRNQIGSSVLQPVQNG